MIGPPSRRSLARVGNGLYGVWPGPSLRSASIDGRPCRRRGVLRIGKTLYVGLSTRTDAAGIAALREATRPLGFRWYTPRSRTAST